MKICRHITNLILGVIGGFILVSNVVFGQVSFSGCYISGALVDPGSTAGCGNSGTNNYCNLASLYVPAFTPTACGTFTTSSGVTHKKATVYTLPAGCTATIEAEFMKRNYLGVGATGTGCSNCGMDGSPDGLTILQSGGVVAMQGSTVNVNVGTCGAYPTLGTYTSAVSTISPGCNNADGYVRMELTGGTFTVGGTSNRADEIITFTINLSGTCGAGCNAVLPIELLNFYGEVVQEKINLRWKVASELNVNYYEIEKSSDGLDWISLSKIPSKSETFGINQLYETNDFYPRKGINYYRLNNIDKNGERGNSKMIAVNFDRETVPIWVNQDEENIYVHINNTTNIHYQVQLFDISGRVVLNEVISPDQTSFLILKEGYPSGIYTLNVYSDLASQVHKIIVH